MTVGSSIYGIREYKINPTSPDAVHPAKGSFDIGMAAYALWISPSIGAGYFAVDATIGWKPVINASMEIHKFHNEMNREFWWYPNYSTITQH